ncbi:TPA: hypothetical protein DHW62_03730 [candidate division WWE3 bacterium]|uniref:DUF1045 domain-containing protein n=1 Tax=candidate division WWE3 bacterium TaxID=2053526 RepID=A0A656PQX7_UNCKA|nr:hypothetical protein P147_WWE3C00001G0393 [candidate division WWE3 bacterium RAAC2_WWE3_1]KKS29737.1 MAG: 2'-5' phosphodiesterase of 2H superfamily [candidate division WWE3 bacterium GW2011_GWB1_42_117]KKS55547.1 MAG: 2'-5' phosphodiesterase of 2H superfamily [candidate division WWE3 bacterium GW2011_GWD2_42_34]KKT06032.1 MAG: 2'-5' phosphodiesterase of 2H superfamily [candidate division WWE3 bacterium GW2011_GWE2_43_18]KKT06950.1 MAG: 2'-5' phosphodiesterase of 2H superfamily [candidate div
MLFGLYYIPSNTEIYELGSHILGYDIVAGERRTCPKEIDTGWVAESSKYGLHMTITDAVTIDEKNLEIVEKRTQEVLGCFSKSLNYSLSLDEIGFWPKDNTQLAIRLNPNENVKMLHNILVGTIQTLGKGSLYTKNLASQISSGKLRYLPDQVEKIRVFHAPYIFEHFKPHFTLLNPFLGSDEERVNVESYIKNSFSKEAHFTIDKLTMVIKEREEDYFQIYKTFDL